MKIAIKIFFITIFQILLHTHLSSTPPPPPHTHTHTHTTTHAHHTHTTTHTHTHTHAHKHSHTRTHTPGAHAHIHTHERVHAPLEDCSPEKIKHGEGNGNIQMRNCYYTTFTQHIKLPPPSTHTHTHAHSCKTYIQTCNHSLTHSHIHTHAYAQIHKIMSPRDKSMTKHKATKTNYCINCNNLDDLRFKVLIYLLSVAFMTYFLKYCSK